MSSVSNKHDIFKAHFEQFFPGVAVKLGYAEEHQAFFYTNAGTHHIVRLSLKGKPYVTSYMDECVCEALKDWNHFSLEGQPYTSSNKDESEVKDWNKFNDQSQDALVSNPVLWPKLPNLFEDKEPTKPPKATTVQLKPEDQAFFDTFFEDLNGSNWRPSAATTFAETKPVSSCPPTFPETKPVSSYPPTFPETKPAYLSFRYPFPARVYPPPFPEPARMVKKNSLSRKEKTPEELRAIRDEIASFGEKPRPSRRGIWVSSTYKFDLTDFDRYNAVTPCHCSFFSSRQAPPKQEHRSFSIHQTSPKQTSSDAKEEKSEEDNNVICRSNLDVIEETCNSTMGDRFCSKPAKKDSAVSLKKSLSLERAEDNVD